MTKWDAEGENSLYLFTLAEFAKIPDGTEIESIVGYKKIKGKDAIDTDTRAGYLAWGVRNPWNHEHKHLFLTFLLTA